MVPAVVTGSRPQTGRPAAFQGGQTVDIPNVSTDPIIGASGAVSKTITILNGGILTVANNGAVTVTAGEKIDIKNGGSFVQSGGNVSLTGDVVIEGSFTQSGGVFDHSTGTKFDVKGPVTQSGGTLNVKLLEISNSRTFTQSGSGATVSITEEYKNLGTFTSSAGTIEFNPTDGTGTWSATGTSTFFNVTIPSGKSQPFGNNFAVRGGWLNSGTATFGASVLTTFNGTSAQSIGGTSVTSFRNVTVNKSGGDISMSVGAVVEGTLTFTLGNIITGTNTLAIASTGSVSRVWARNR